MPHFECGAFNHSATLPLLYAGIFYHFSGFLQSWYTAAMMNYYGTAHAGVGNWAWIPVVGGGIVLLMVWSLFWKGLALWHSAQRRQPWWFVAVLLINTAGILEIVYLFGVAKLRFSKLFSR